MVLPDVSTEAGEDYVGLFRDRLSSGTHSICRVQMGMHCVPTLVHIMQHEDWKAMAYLTYIGLKQEYIFPHLISLPFIKYYSIADWSSFSLRYWRAYPFKDPNIE